MEENKILSAEDGYETFEVFTESFSKIVQATNISMALYHFWQQHPNIKVIAVESELFKQAEQQLKQQAAGVWVKASERLPQPNYRKCVKEFGNKFGGRYNVSTYRAGNPQSEKYWKETVEFWLDESQQSQEQSKPVLSDDETKNSLAWEYNPFPEQPTSLTDEYIERMAEKEYPILSFEEFLTSPESERPYFQHAESQKLKREGYKAALTNRQQENKASEQKVH